VNEEQLKFMGWQECLDSVRGSLRGYPDCGGDVEIMREIERIVAQRIAEYNKQRKEQ
jgi:hypothetical protein